MAQNMIAARRTTLRLALLCVAWASAGPRSLLAATADAERRIVVDWRTGLAIHGFDPVAYFVERRAVAGHPEHDHAFAGVIWRFRSAGNRTAFAAAPQTYLPRFGGYDPRGVARGVAAPGNPLVWLIAAGRLYLFNSIESRRLFAADPRAASAAAEKAWPGVAAALLP